VFGIGSGPLSIAASLLGLGLVCLDLALVYWVFRDARHRVDDALLVACAVIAALIFPFVGTLIYAIVRPPEFLEDAYEREVSIQANEALVKTLGELARSNRELTAQVGRLEQLIVVRRKSSGGSSAREAAAPSSVPPPRR
jgi:hypothetical protein